MSEGPVADESLQRSPGRVAAESDAGVILDPSAPLSEGSTPEVPNAGLLDQQETSSEGVGDTPGAHGIESGRENPAETSPAFPTDDLSFGKLANLAVIENTRDITSKSQTAEDPVIPTNFPESVGRVVMKKNTDSLKNLRLYSSSDSDSCKEAEMTDFMADKDWQIGSNDSSDIEFFECDDGDRSKSSGKGERLCFNPLGEDLSTFPLPDLSKLQIDCDKEEFMLMGEVQSVIVDVVTIHALPKTPAYDLDTILFVEQDSKRVPLGAIVDVIGPVTSPIYCVRIDIKDDRSLSSGMKVYSAPQSHLTHYVFIKELMKIKGSDASWLHDQEMPPEAVEDSSEEEVPEEPRQRQRKRCRSSPERHQSFERSMNRCNTLNTRVTNLASTIQEYNSERSVPGYISNRMVAPRPLVPFPRLFNPWAQTFVPRPSPPFYPPRGNSNRYPGPSRPF